MTWQYPFFRAPTQSRDGSRPSLKNLRGSESKEITFTLVFGGGVTKFLLYLSVCGSGSDEESTVTDVRSSGVRWGLGGSVGGRTAEYGDLQSSVWRGR